MSSQIVKRDARPAARQRVRRDPALLADLLLGAHARLEQGATFAARGVLGS